MSWCVIWSSQVNMDKSNDLVDCFVALEGNGGLAWLAIGQTVQVKGYLGAKEKEILDMPFIFPKGT